jgi:transposase-like protein
MAIRQKVKHTRTLRQDQAQFVLRSRYQATDLARLLDVHPTTLTAIRRRKHWKHLDERPMSGRQKRNPAPRDLVRGFSVNKEELVLPKCLAQAVGAYHRGGEGQISTASASGPAGEPKHHKRQEFPNEQQ